MSGPCLAASGNRLGPYVWRRRLASATSRPFAVSLPSRRTTSSAAIACHAVASLADPVLAASFIRRLPFTRTTDQKHRYDGLTNVGLMGRKTRTLVREKIPAQDPDPHDKQQEIGKELRPHHGQEAPRLDLPLLLDEGLPARLLQPDEPQVPGFVDLLPVLMQEDGSP